MYSIIDKKAKKLQGDKVNISMSLNMVRTLVDELVKQRENFESFWNAALIESNKLSKSLNKNETLKKFPYFNGMEEPSCPRSQFKELDTINNDSAAKIYWKELYVEGFDTIILDLKDKLNSEQYQLCAEIEELLLNGITGEECELKTNLIDQHYGKATKKIDAPLYALTHEELKDELKYLKNKWQDQNEFVEPATFTEISNMIEHSFKSTPLRIWKLHAPTVLTLVQIIIATAGTSAFAERTFSLARRLKSYLRLGMGDEMFDALGLMGWYNNEVDEMVNLETIGNEYIEKCENDSRFKNYGEKFTFEDFVTK